MYIILIIGIVLRVIVACLGFNTRRLGRCLQTAAVAFKWAVADPLLPPLFGVLASLIGCLVIHNHLRVIHGSTGVTCDVFHGDWALDRTYTLYNSSECPFAAQNLDKDDRKWRWKPKDCDFRSFNAARILRTLRDKRVVFVGDSTGRTQWQSLVCMLMGGVKNKSSLYEINGRLITNTVAFLGVRFDSFNLTVEFFRSVFLVERGSPQGNAPERVFSTLKLDELESVSKEWIDSDVLVFESGQWWVPQSFFDMGRYFQTGNSVKFSMKISTAFQTALVTWASWVEANIDRNRTRIFFRTSRPSELRSPENVSSEHQSKDRLKKKRALLNTVQEVVKNMKFRVTVLDLTSTSNGSNVSVCDDSLPGVADSLNEIMLSQLAIDYAPPPPLIHYDLQAYL